MDKVTALRLISPRSLRWQDVDPAGHPFDPAAAPAVVRSLPPAAEVPARPRNVDYSAKIAWSRSTGDPWADTMSLALIGHYGRWAGGWRWATGEGDFDGGPGWTWCCSLHSMSAPDATLDTVTTALIEWRAWLEDLSERFGRFLPIPPAAGEDDVLDVWERAVAHLVTVVVDRTGAGSGWYGHCEQVLGWFLAAAGIPADRHGQLIEHAVGGRFESWVEPKGAQVREVAERLATRLWHPDA
ncbi:hypothetical protein [Symbioplanes lichenis]|uniref:hypothetical protein n=1 Tax=Symbioplanes lichenis TaxID=1629072 RepID=UPI00273974B4|nr:hypothetical protein [Actinoplanes lichenis]